MITLSKVGNAIKFVFVDNGTYLFNGTIEVPVNSLSLVTDSSGMATFKKSASNDIFISAAYSELGMSKSELEDWYKENMVGETGGGGGGGVTTGEVQTMIDESISGKADSSAVTQEISAATVDYFDGAEYDSGTTRINFYHGNTVKAYIDASAFIVDGMIDDVRIETISGVSYLVIDFNTASGKEDIQIPLTDIFNPSNYYDKTEIDNIVSGLNDSIDTKFDASAITAYSTTVEVGNAIDAATSGKADTTAVTQAISAATDDMATQTWVGEQGYITGVDLSNYATLDNVSEATSGKLDTSTFETYSAATSTEIGGKLAVSDFNTYSGAVDTAISSKASESDLSALTDVVSAHTANTDIHVTTAQTAAWDAKSDFSGSYNDLTDKPTIPTVPTSNTAFTNDAGYITSDAISGKADTTAVTEAISEATSGKADTTAVTQSITEATSGKLDTSTFETYSGSVETALSGKQDTLSAGTGISIVDNVISAEGGGGGKAIEAGRGISVTTGATADTVSFNLPISAGTGSNSIVIGDSYDVSNRATGNGAIALNGVGFVPTHALGDNSLAIGVSTNSIGKNSLAGGDRCNSSGACSFSFGLFSKTKNYNEASFGRNNKSAFLSDDFGNSGNSLFNIGNGIGMAVSTSHNAFEVRQNGDIYIADTNDTSTTNFYEKPMIKLQDAIGGGGMTEDDELLLATALTGLNDRKIDTSEVKANYQKKGDYATKTYVATALEPYETKLDEINTEEVATFALNDLNERLTALETAVQALQALHNNE